MKTVRRTLERSTFEAYLAECSHPDEYATSDEASRDEILKRFPFSVMLKVSYPELDFANRWCWKKLAQVTANVLKPTQSIGSASSQNLMNILEFGLLIGSRRPTTTLGSMNGTFRVSKQGKCSSRFSMRLIGARTMQNNSPNNAIQRTPTVPLI
jgi:hypothetical protein